MDQEITLTEEALMERFPFLPNHLNPNAPFDFGLGGTMFETYGDERAFVSSFPRNRIWTLVDSEHGLCIVSGYWLINRLGYFISFVPCDSGSTYTAVLDDVDGGAL